MRKLILCGLLINALILLNNHSATENSGILPVSFSGYEREVPDMEPLLEVTVTAYSPTEEECDEDPYITAFQEPVRTGIIAVSRDLENELDLRPGDMVHLEGLGVFEVRDRMALRWKKKMDVFFYESDDALSFGVRRARVLKVERPQTSI